MATNAQSQLRFDFNDAPRIHASPKGYKGLSGFHKYWGKKPIEAWSFLIETLTKPDDIVLDPFLGSGLIAKESVDQNRRFIGFDINPISIKLTKLYLQHPEYLELKTTLEKLKKTVKPVIDEMYLLESGDTLSHLFWNKDHIVKTWIKPNRKRIEVHLTDKEIAQLEKASEYTPKHIDAIQLYDNSRINSNRELTYNDLFTPRALRTIDLLKEEINAFDGNLKRALELILSASLGQMSKMVFAISRKGKGEETKIIQVGSWVIGYWRPKEHFEVNAWNCFENKANKLLKAIKNMDHQETGSVTEDLSKLLTSDAKVYLYVGDSEELLKDIPSNSVKVVLTDPPHGDRIPYLELSEMWNSVLELEVDYSDELVVSNAKERSKDKDEYNRKLNSILTESTRVLENNGVMAVMFNTRSQEHWDSLKALEKNSPLNYIGCYPLKYSAGSVVQDNRKGGLKNDFVLIYAKNPDIEQINTVLNKFNILDEWSNEHPGKGA